MDTSYVAVGTVIYMITDSLTCRPQEKPRRSGAGQDAIVQVVVGADGLDDALTAPSPATYL